MLQTQIFTQKYRRWLRFYSEFLIKKLVAGVSGLLFFLGYLLLKTGWDSSQPKIFMFLAAVFKHFQGICIYFMFLSINYPFPATSNL